MGRERDKKREEGRTPSKVPVEFGQLPEDDCPQMGSVQAQKYFQSKKQKMPEV